MPGACFKLQGRASLTSKTPLCQSRIPLIFLQALLYIYIIYMYIRYLRIYIYAFFARHMLVFSIKFSPWWILTLCSKVWTFNMSSCPNNCNGHGRCDFSQCVCEPPWPGVLAIQLKRPLKWGARSMLVKDEKSIVYILFFKHIHTHTQLYFFIFLHTRLYKNYIVYSRFVNEHLDY